MPTYGYRCPACATEFDVWQKMSDPPGAVCPSCGTSAQRLFFPAGIVFKGTGFYATDSRAKSKSGSTPASSPKTSSNGSSSDGSSTTPTPAAQSGASTSSSEPS